MVLNGSFPKLDTFTLMLVADYSQTFFGTGSISSNKGIRLTLNNPLIFENVLLNNIMLSFIDVH